MPLDDDLYDGESDAVSSITNCAFPTHPTWDQRRQLSIDISNLAPPDLPGVLLLIRNYVKVLEMRELLPHEERVLPWEAQHQSIPNVDSTDPIQLQCGFRLDNADVELLRQLRQYVDDCYVPHFVPKENCCICEGLWSCGRILFCGNDSCSCAADAGLMIGNEGNLLGVYCEKHLPTSRIPGAKRWISDEDLVEEIMSEYSIDEDFDDDEADEPHYTDAERFAFILESTPYLHYKQKLLGATATLHFGPASYSSVPSAAGDLDKKVFAGAKINANAYTPPAMVVQGMSTQRPMAYPPPSQSASEKRLGLPEFPHGKAVVGAIVDYLAKAQDGWQRARVLQWDREKKMHLVQLITSDQKLWAELDTDNTLVLYLPNEENVVDGPIVKLIRPLAQGVVEWHPKPREFAKAP
ncbi:hypothetical protein BBO99_00004277 [Phytophthora kernoviae]|uniref:Uncharacterized protein n=1 Tax=Phytophthora kernoviae TaxID=325452 RepID=A0A3R7GN79_9STRA|nr:hypothetical protein BBI17_006686 [Phytophthora kernoviae]RLN80730.1 hypothetical protein BBO99_00004277 [Phytophthora kernoviae]